MDRAYLDHAATTPMRAEVREAMAPCLDVRFGNPSSPHAEGRAARAAVEGARDTVARALGVDGGEIFFVRGGTEADNLAVLGRADRARRAGRTPLLVVSAVEHRAVLEAADAVATDGGEVVRLPMSPEGAPDDDVLETALGRTPDLVSVLWVNNETGLRLPIEELAARCSTSDTAFHTDAVQAVGKVPVRPHDAGVDLLSASGHKIGGPKGTGLLFVRKDVELEPRLFGGGQEGGLRPGTEDVAGAVGLARAVELACAEVEEEAERLARLRDALEGRLTAAIPDLRVHGKEAPRAPHILNVGIPDADLDSLLVAMDLAGVSVSSGSACSSGARIASHVLTALYGDQAAAVAPLRFSLGWTTTESDIRRAADAAISAVGRIRATAGSVGGSP